MTRSAAAILTLVALCAAILALASWVARRTYNAADFAIANRRLGAWTVALGYVANAVNPWMLMLMGAAAFSWGLSAAWAWAALLSGCILNLWFVAPRLRTGSAGQGSITLTQVLSADAGDRLQPVVVRSAVFITFVLLLLQSGAMLRAASALFMANFGFDPGSVIFLSVCLAAGCIFAGGLRAASIGESVQTIVVFGVVLFLALPALVATGGWRELHAALAVTDPAAIEWLGGKSGVVAVAFAAGVLGMGLAMSGQPHALNRIMAAKDELTLRTARWLALAAIALLLGAVLLAGWCASVLYAGLEQPEQALIAIANRLLPPWLAAISVVVLLAAIIFSVGSQLLVMATALAVDLRRSTAPVLLGWLRAAVAFAAVLVCAFTLYAPAGILQHGVLSFAALGASFGPLLLVRLSGKRIRPGSTLGAMWAGFVLSVLFHLLPDAPGDFLERVLPFVAALGIALTGGERRRNPDRADRSQETVHDRVPI